MSDPRKRIDERALEKEEENYFNEDSDEEDSASASVANTNKVKSQPILPNGSTESHQSTRSGGLVDYEDDEDDEDYKPPPERHAESSGEDGVVDSLFVKRKASSKEDTQQKALQQLPKKPKLNAFSSTLEKGLTPSKKRASISSDAPRADSSPEASHEQEVSAESSDSERSAYVGNAVDKEASPDSSSDDLQDYPHNIGRGDACPLLHILRRLP